MWVGGSLELSEWGQICPIPSQFLAIEGDGGSMSGPGEERDPPRSMQSTSRKDARKGHVLSNIDSHLNQNIYKQGAMLEPFKKISMLWVVEIPSNVESKMSRDTISMECHLAVPETKPQ